MQTTLMNNTINTVKQHKEIKIIRNLLSIGDILQVQKKMQEELDMDKKAEIFRLRERLAALELENKTGCEQANLKFFLDGIFSKIWCFPGGECLKKNTNSLDYNLEAFYDRMLDVLQIEVLKKEHKAIWNEMGNLHPQFYCLQTNFKFNGNRTWSFYAYGGDQSLEGICGYGHAQTKDEAEAKAYQMMFATILMKQSRKVDRETLRKLLLRSGIESNPGPVQKGMRKHKVDFDPDKRFLLSIKSSVFKNDKRLMDLNFYEIFDLLLEEATPMMQSVKNIPNTNYFLIPKNLIFIYFNKQHLTPMSMDYSVISEMRNSIANQIMSQEQMVQVAYKLTLANMMSMYQTHDVNQGIRRFRTIFADELKSFSDKYGIKFSDPLAILNKIYPRILIPTFTYSPSRDIGNKLCGSISNENLLLMQENVFDPEEYSIEENGQYDRNGKLHVYIRDKSCFSAYLGTHQIYIPTRYMKDMKLKTVAGQLSKLKILHDSVEDYTQREDIQLRIMKILIANIDLNNIKSKIVDMMVKKHGVDLNKRFNLEHGPSDEIVQIDIIFENIMRFVPTFPTRTGLARAFQEIEKDKIQKIEEDMPEKQVGDYIRVECPKLQTFMRALQCNVSEWMKMLNIPTRGDYFMTTGFVRELKHYLTFEYSPTEPKLVADFVEKDWLKEDEAPSKSGIGNKFKAPFVGLKNFFLNTKNAVMNVNQVSQKISAVVDNFAARLEETGMSKTSSGIINFDTKSIASKFLSVKNIFNSILSDVLDKFCGIFGFRYEGNLTTDQFLLGYLLLINTNDERVKFFVILDIVTSLGLTDVLWNFIKILYTKFKGMFNEPETVGFDSYMESFKKDIDVSKTENEEKLKKIVEEVQKEKIVEDTDFMADMWKKLEDNCPKVLAVLATTFALSVGLKSIPKGKSMEEKIAGGLRAFSFITLGAMAIPKMYSGVMVVFKLVSEWIKEQWNSENPSTYTKLKEMNDWMKTISYDTLVSPVLASSDLKYIYQYQLDYVKLIKFRKDRYLLDGNDKRTFDSIERNMRSIYTAMEAAFTYHVGMLEPLTICFTSDQPGVGKTDLKDLTGKVVMNQFRKCLETDLKTMQLFNGPLWSINDIPYNITTGCKHMDGLGNQYLFCNDESNISKTITAEEYAEIMKTKSGTLNILSMAHLDNKGKVCRCMVYIENTNTPFPEFDGIYNMDAYYRRRILVDVKLNKKYLDESGQIDERKVSIEERAKGKHLTLTVLNPTNTKRVPLNKDLVKLTAEQWLLYIEAVAQKHYLKENRRLIVKKGNLAYMRMANIAWSQDIINAATAINDDDSLKSTSDGLFEMFKKVDDLTKEDAENLINYDDEEVRLLNKVKPKIKAVIDSLVKDHKIEIRDNLDEGQEVEFSEEIEERFMQLPVQIRSSFVNFILDDQKGGDMSAIRTLDMRQLKENLKEIKKLVNISNIKEVADEDFSTFLTLKEENGFYALFPSTQKRKLQKGLIDFTKFEILEGEKGMGVLLYPVESRDEKTQEILLYWMLEITDGAFARTLDDLKKRLKAVIQKERRKSESKSLANKWRDMKKRIASTCENISNYGWYKILRETAGVFFKAAVATCGVFCAFKVIMSFAEMFSPKSVSYNDKTYGKVMQPPKVVGYNTDDYGDLISILKRNNYDIQFTYRDNCGERIRKGTATGLKADYIVTAAHVVPETETDITVEVYDMIKSTFAPNDAVKKFSIRVKKHVSFIPNTDIAIIHLPGLRSARDITGMFLSEQDLGTHCVNLSSMTASGLIVDTDREKEFKSRSRTYMTVGQCNATVTEKYRELYSKNSMSNRVAILNSEHQLYVEKGYSGSIYFHFNSKLRHHALLGVLVATINDYANRHYVELLTQEMIEKALKQFTEPSGFTVEQTELPPIGEDHYIHKVKLACYDVYKSPFPNQGVKKDLGFKRTFIEDMWDTNVQPAIMSENDKRIPSGARHFLEVSLNKYDNSNLPFMTHTECEFALKGLTYLTKHFYPHVSGMRILDTRTAIIGTKIQGDKPINIHTSAGLPYKLEPGAVGKTKYIFYNEHNFCYEIKDKVYTDVRSMEQAYLQRNIPLNYKLEVVKKELVSEKKILEPKTRTVATGNFIHLILYNKYHRMFKVFLAHTPYVYGKVGPYALGIDMEKDADKIVRHMKFLDYMVDFDVAAWERNVSYAAFAIHAKMIVNLLENGHRKLGLPFNRNNTINIIFGLLTDYMHSYVVFEDFVMTKTGGMLSGHPGTLIENSSVHMIYLITIVNRILLENNSPNSNNVQYIIDNVRFMMAADDIIISVSPQARNVVTIERIVQGYKELNLGVTAPDKTSEISKKTIHEIQFLKHNFFQVEDEDGKLKWMAKCSLEIPQSLFLWYRTDSKLQKEYQIESNFETAFRFLYHHGEETYEKYRAEINRQGQKQDFEFMLDYANMKALIEHTHAKENYLQERANALDEEEH